MQTWMCLHDNSIKMEQICKANILWELITLLGNLSFPHFFMIDALINQILLSRSLTVKLLNLPN